MHWKPIFRICFVNLSSARKNTHQKNQKALTRSNKHEIALKFLKWVEFCPWWFDKSPSPRRINCQELYVKFIKDGEVPKEIAWWGLPKLGGARLTRFPWELTVKDTSKTIWNKSDHSFSIFKNLHQIIQIMIFEYVSYFLLQWPRVKP
jgi:hypothetical protein